MMNGPIEVVQNYLNLVTVKLQYVSFGDLETSLVEMCNCKQCAEEHFVTWVVLQTPSEYLKPKHRARPSL